MGAIEKKDVDTRAICANARDALRAFARACRAFVKAPACFISAAFQRLGQVFRASLRLLAAGHARVVHLLEALEVTRAQGRPGAGRSHGPPANKKARGSHHRIGRTTGGFGRRNTRDLEVTMTIRKRRSTRAPMRSPGRPPLAGRAAQKRFWQAIAAGASSEDAALEAGVSPAVGPRLFRKAGGMPPAIFRSSAKPLSGRSLSLAEREEIALLNVQGHFLRDWATPRPGCLDNLP
jgi:hypothetical protein